MKLKKKTAMIISLALGVTLFATTAFAEVNSKSGYDQIKDSMKYTADSCSNKLSSYTANLSFEFKDNDDIISSGDNVIKYDMVNGRKEDTSTRTNKLLKKEQQYSYNDKDCSISYNYNGDTYYEEDYDSPNTEKLFNDPFKKYKFEDVEGVIDAVVGNLKDSIIVNQKTDGSKEYTGSLSESQIPSLINALVSFGYKNSFNGYCSSSIGIDPISINITKDILVKEVNGKVSVDKNGLIQNIIVFGVLSGKDKNNQDHNLSFDLLLKLTDVNSTVLKKPDLSGKKVSYRKRTSINIGIADAGKYIGQYKNNIVIEKDGKLQKIGERIIDITSIDEKYIKGRYHEEYEKGYEQYSKDIKDIKFDSVRIQESGDSNFNYVDDKSGKTMHGSIYIYNDEPIVIFSIDQSKNNSGYNVMFEKVLD